MLYVTTRCNKDAFTAHRALVEDRGPDGGYYVPFILPQYTPDELQAFASKSPSQTIADVVNLFFSARLTGWDIDFCVGRNALRISQMNNKIIIGELWHNLGGRFNYIAESISKKIQNSEASRTSDWMYITVRIAVLFAMYGEFLRTGVLTLEQPFDISLPAGDFSAPIAAFYAKKMGLPIETIICTCEENCTVWDFIHRGIFSIVSAQENDFGAERLLCATAGITSVEEFLNCCKDRRSYIVDEELLPAINQGLFCSVAGQGRAVSLINSIFRGDLYIVDPVTALCYGGLQDYRAKTGSNRLTVLLSEVTPLAHITELSAATGVDAERIPGLVNQ